MDPELEFAFILAAVVELEVVESSTNCGLTVFNAVFVDTDSGKLGACRTAATTPVRGFEKLPKEVLAGTSGGLVTGVRQWCKGTACVGSGGVCFVGVGPDRDG